MFLVTGGTAPITPPSTGGSMAEHQAVMREVVSSTPAGPALRVLK